MMRRILTMAPAAVLLVLAQPVFAEGTDLEKFGQAFIDAERAAWLEGNLAPLEALEHPEVVYQNINGNVMRGRDKHLQEIRDTLAHWNGAPITQDWRYLMGDGNMLAVSYRWVVGLPEGPQEFVGIAVMRLQDGKIIEEWGGGYIQAVNSGG